MIIVLLFLALIGVALLAAALSIILVHFFLKGLEWLALHTRCLRYEVRNSNEYTGQHNNKETRANDITIRPYAVSRYDLYDIIRNRINKMSENRIGNHCPDDKTDTNKEKYNRYVNRSLPRPTPCPLPSPVKHVGNILNKLLRRVNESGKEPPFLRG